MAVESYLPTTDAKRTVEKMVKVKPKPIDLITVETPGRPVPTSDVFESEATDKNKKTTIKKKREKIKRDSILILTEKPQAANKIANALGDARKYAENKVPYYEVKKDGKNIIVATAVGHLFNLHYSKGQKGWPIFKTEWQPSYKDKHAAFTKNYYDLLKKLSKRSKEIIIATDYDIEGEVIGWNVLRFLFNKENAKRMKYSTLTKDELIISYENSMPSLDWGQAYAGETRHYIDWLYGINLSRGLMSAIKTTGSFKLLSIGRVQGPALKIIVDREKEIKSFKPKPYWLVTALHDGIEFKHPKDIFKKSELEKFKDIKKAIAETKKKTEIIQPPHPFDLTSLQREAHNKLRLSPSQTLRTAQSLYLDGVISYPRTSSQKIPNQINPKSILKKLRKKYAEQVDQVSRTKPIEGKKDDPAHPSIYPTGDLKKMNEDEKKLYDLIVRRFISCFSPNAKTDNKKITLKAGDHKFTTSGIQILEKGWMSVYPHKMEEIELPDINGPVDIEKINFLDKETQPPRRYTPTSLISLLEKMNLGTKATRSHIVDTLFDRGYLDGRSIEPTPLGEKLIEALQEYSPIIIEEELTRNVEDRMEEIQNITTGFEEKEKEIISHTERIILDISKDFKSHEVEIGKKLMKGTEELREMIKEHNTLMECPKCKKGQLAIRYSKKIKRYFVACDAYPDCKTTYSLPPNSLIKKTEKVNEEGLPILMAIRKGKRPWEFPFDPHWREKQEAQKAKEEKQKRTNSNKAK